MVGNGMMRVATITFHAAHNFGSVLQAYALQSVIEGISANIEYKILNFRSQEQKKSYALIKEGKSFKVVIKNILRIPYRKQLQEKYDKFESFIKCELHLTQEEIDEYSEVPEEWKNFDIYISGSDQIWNVRAKDFFDINFLDFVKEKRKVSYAASFGPLMIDWSNYNFEKYKKLLSEYKYISVREVGSAMNVEKLINKKCDIHVDPTLLLSVNEWRAIQSSANYNNGKYILLYCLEPTIEQLRIAKYISQKLKLPIVSLKPANKNDIINSFIKKYDSGPKDFLSYVDHASLVLSSSFHGTAFSMIYHKPFYVLNGMRDNRISYILKATEMTERSIDNIKDAEKVKLTLPDGKKIDEVLGRERLKSMKYLEKVLQID